MHVYFFPAVRRFTVKGERLPVLERATPPLPDTHAAVYPVIALPLLAPGRNDTLSEPEATLAASTRVGAPGEPTITAADLTDQDPVPRAFVARTLHVYFLPVVRPDTVNGEPVPVLLLFTPPLLDAHVVAYRVIALPLLAPALNDTTNGPVALVVEPDTAFTRLGAPGAVDGVTFADSADCAPTPTELTAATLNL